MKTLLAAIAVVSFTGAFAACGGDDDSASDVTLDEMALMVLPQSSFGTDYADMVVAEGAGEKHNGATAEATVDPEDTIDDIAAAGRVTGYAMSYTDPELLAAGGEGVSSVGSEIHLFEDGDSVAAFVAKEIADGERLKGETFPAFTLESFLEFSVPDMGDEGVGYTWGVKVDGQRLYTIAIGFREGPLLALASLTTTGSGDLRTLVEQWAAKLEERVQGVLDGTITEAG